MVVVVAPRCRAQRRHRNAPATPMRSVVGSSSSPLLPVIATTGPANCRRAACPIICSASSVCHAPATRQRCRALTPDLRPIRLSPLSNCLINEAVTIKVGAAQRNVERSRLQGASINRYRSECHRRVEVRNCATQAPARNSAAHIRSPRALSGCPVPRHASRAVRACWTSENGERTPATS